MEVLERRPMVTVIMVMIMMMANTKQQSETLKHPMKQELNKTEDYHQEITRLMMITTMMMISKT